MALLYWSNPLLNTLSYSATLPFGGNWIPTTLFLPSIIAITPSAGSNAGGDFITIIGSNFDNGVSVTVGGVAVTSLKVLDSTVLTGYTGAHAIGAVDVIVTNSDTNTSKLTGGFTYLIPQWWGYNPPSPFGIPTGEAAWWSYGGPPLPFRYITSESPLQSAISSPPLPPNAPILKKALPYPPTVDPISWTTWTGGNPPDTSGWYFSNNGYTTIQGTFLILTLGTGQGGAPKHPRSWDKIAAFATGNSGMLGGLPSVTYRNGIIYAGDDYTSGTTPPTVREFDGGVDHLLFTVPPTAAGFFPVPAAPILSYYVTSSDGATDYKYAITALDINGNHSAGSPILDAPAGHATLTSLDGVIISWTAVPNAVGYNIYRTTSSGTPSTTGLIGGSSTLTFTDFGANGDGSTLPATNNTAILSPVPTNNGPFGTTGTTIYNYVVTALNATGSTAGSATVNIINGNITLTSNNYNQITWPNVTGATSYNIYRTVTLGTVSSIGIIGNVKPAGYQTGFINFFNDTGLAGDNTTPPITNTTGLSTPTVPTLTGYYSAAGTGATDYKYAEVALNAMGHSIGSAILDVPAGTATLSSTNYPSLSVSIVAGATSYDIYRTTSGGTPSSTGKIGNILPSSSTFPVFNDTGLVADGSTLPNTNTAAVSPIIPIAVMTMLLVGDALFLTSLDSGNSSSTWTGRAFYYDIPGQLLFPLGAPFPTGEVPYALAWHQNKLWCGTNAGNGSNGNVYWIRPNVDLLWTKDTKSLSTPTAPVVAGYVTSSGGATDYKYALTAIDGSGNHSAGSVALDAPAGAAVLSSTVGNIINFTSVPGAVSYNIYRTSSSGTPSTTGLIGSVSAGTPLTFNDLGLIADGSTMPATSNSGLTTPVPISNGNFGTPGSTDNKYVVVALNALGHTAGSSIVDFPTSNATLSGTNYNQLVWPQVVGATSFNVYRTVSGGTPSSTGLIGNILPGGVSTSYTTFFNDTGLPGDASSPPITNTSGVATPSVPTLGGYFTFAGPGATDYKYGIVALNALGHSGPGAVVDVPAAPATLNSTNYIILTIPTVVGAVSYNVYRTATSGTPNTVGIIGNTTNVTLGFPTFIDNGLAGDTTIFANVINTTSLNGVDSMMSFGGQLYIGCDNVAGTFGILNVRSVTGAYSAAIIGTGGTARVNNGWISLRIFNGVLYAAYWNPDTTAIAKIYSITTAGIATLVYTGATSTLRPYINLFAVGNTLYALGGGSGLRASLISTPDGINWTDLSAILNNITTETATPAIGIIGV